MDAEGRVQYIYIGKSLDYTSPPPLLDSSEFFNGPKKKTLKGPKRDLISLLEALYFQWNELFSDINNKSNEPFPKMFSKTFPNESGQQ